MENGKLLQFSYCFIILDALEFTFTAYNQRKREGGKIKMHAIYSKFYFVLN